MKRELPVSLSVALAVLLAADAASPPARGGDDPLLAVFEIEARGEAAGPAVLDGLRERLATRMAAAGFRVVPHAELRARLAKEACRDGGCHVELARALAASHLLSTGLTKLEGRCQLTAVLEGLEEQPARSFYRSRRGGSTGDPERTVLSAVAHAVASERSGCAAKELEEAAGRLSDRLAAQVEARRAGKPLVPVVIFSRDVPAGKRLDYDMVARMKVPEGFVEPGAVEPHDIEKFMDLPLRRAVLRGEVLTGSVFAP